MLILVGVTKLACCSLTLALLAPRFRSLCRLFFSFLRTVLARCLAASSSDVVGIVRFVLSKIHGRKVPNWYADPWKEGPKLVDVYASHISMEGNPNRYVVP